MELKIIIILISALLLCALVEPSSTMARQQSNPGATSSQKSKSTGNDSCDGALDIVPTGKMTFIRKRRPAAKEKKPPARPSDMKKPVSDKKP